MASKMAANFREGKLKLVSPLGRPYRESNTAIMYFILRGKVNTEFKAFVKEVITIMCVYICDGFYS